MSRKFLLSLTDINCDRAEFRGLGDIHQYDDWRRGANYLQRITDLLPRLPPVERDVVELYYSHGKKQEVIARMLGLSQQAVSHRLHSAYRRIIFMLEQPDVNPGQMQRDLAVLLSNPFTVKVLVDFASTSSQTVTARRLGVPQQRVCWHLNAGLKALRESLSLDAVFYVKYFEDLRQHRNILREVLAGRRKRSSDGEEQRYRHYARGQAASYGRRAGAGQGQSAAADEGRRAAAG